jgi:uncharacterized protein (DUF362 family)
MSPPYHPTISYPEYPFGAAVGRDANPVYDAVRRLLISLGYDAEVCGTPRWNPLGEIIEPGMTVVIKPNWVLSRHPAGKDLYSVVTHPAVIRAVVDYCWIALRGSGRIIVADAPQYDCNFEELMQATSLPAVRDFVRSQGGAEMEIRDLRNYWSAGRHFPSMTRPLPGDPQGQIAVELGQESALESRASERFYGAAYHRQETARAQRPGAHRYVFSGTVLKSDTLISIPKLKVHKKVGVTLNLKGLMGVNTNKNLCVHYTLAPSSEGGDQYPDGWFTRSEEALIKLERWMYDHFLAPRRRSLEYIHRTAYWVHGKTLGPLGWRVPQEKRLLDAGNWHGNDSAWRMVADLTRIIHFADAGGKLQTTQQRRTFSVVDGVLGGENNGPLAPDPKPGGVLLAGEGYAAVDVAATRWMGFAPERLAQFNVLKDRSLDLDLTGFTDLQFVSDERELLDRIMNSVDRCAAFLPHPGWQGSIEI